MNKNMPPTPQKKLGDDLEPPSKRMNSGRLLNYDQASVENVSLTKKLNEIKFP